MRQYWWKIASIALLLYTFIAGFLIQVPDIGNLNHTIRNLFFHVPMWFGQLTLISISLVYSILYLRKPDMRFDIYSNEYARTSIVFGCLGLITGAIWANYTWGAPWNNDPKQLGAAIALLIYLAYFVLRNSMTDIDKRSRVAAVYNIFAYCMYIPLIFILPRLVESLHPGGKGVEGNPGLGGEDLDPTMRMVFWPAVFGWTLLGVWITTLRLRLRLLEEKKQLFYKMKYLIVTISFLFLLFSGFAQDTTAKEVQTGLRADGKIYVVMAVVVTILSGLVIYVINIDRKISRLEKNNS